MLQSAVAVGSIVTLIQFVVETLGVVDVPKLVQLSTLVFAVILVSLWVALKYRLVNTHTVFIAAISAFYIYEIIVIPQRSEDQLTPMWYTILIGGAYVFGNLRWGVLMTFLSSGGFFYAVKTSTHFELSNEEYITGFLALICASGIFYIVTRETADLVDRLNALSERDPLTGLLNRRALEMKYAEDVAKSAADRGDLSLAIIDIDNFKSVNDSLGHAAGDDVIIGLAEILKSYLRDGDLIARTGGDEFVVVMPACNSSSAKYLLTGLQESFVKLTIERFSNLSAASPSLSIGLVSYRCVDASLQEALRSADQALYRAKRAGKNRIHTAAIRGSQDYHS